jgi:seryl-tRNA synthetase
MLDIRKIREQPDEVKVALARRGGGIESVIDEILSLDERRRQLVSQADTLRAERNRISKEVSRLKEASDRTTLIQESQLIGQRLETLTADVNAVDAALRDRQLELPNLPLPEVPDGPDEHANVVVGAWGEPRTLAFPARPHWEIGAHLGILNLEWGVKLAGSRFYVLAGQGARLQRALIQWMLNYHVDEAGRHELYVPFVVKEEALWAAGQLPKFRDNLYHDVHDDIWLVPTAEIPITNIYRDEILPPGELPKRYVAYTPCFRREHMSAGRDTRGIKRGHQFDKVEMYTFCPPEDSPAELRRILAGPSTVTR